MTDSDYAIAVAALALQRSRKMSSSAVRNQLMLWRSENAAPSKIDSALDYAGHPRPTVNASASSAQADIDKGIAMGISAIPISSDLYPPTLRDIEDAPPVVFVRGNLAALHSLPGVAVVGTRKASPHGLLIARRIAEYLSAEGWSVVSGLALGVDAAAHEGALLGKTPTFAVLAHGLEKAQPTANQALAARILEAGGAWISEHVVGVKPIPGNFVLRNRIQVGLSVASVIVEGEEQSGSATQAEFCVRNRRILFAVLPDPKAVVAVNTVSALPRMLVKLRGAMPIHSRSDYPAMMEKIKGHAQALEQGH